MDLYENLIHMIYPEFKKAQESRFTKHFKDYNNRNYYVDKFKLNGHKIFIGEDKRTTILIKNIPRNMTKNQLKLILEKIANINYIYIPLFMLSEDNLRYAFVNVINSKSIIDIYLKLRKMKFEYDNPKTKMEILYSKIQGKKALIENFKEERNIFKKNINYY